MTPEDKFAEALAKITGTFQEKIAAASPDVSLHNMKLAEVIDHPKFFEGFHARITERIGDFSAFMNALDR